MSHQLTLTAKFDDLCREFRQVLETYTSEDTMISALNQLENYRKEEVILKRRIAELETQVATQSKTIDNQNTRLRSVRFSLQSETELKRKTQKERDQYRNKVKVIAKMLDDDPGISKKTPEAIKKQIFSSVNLRSLQLIEETEDTETSMSGTEWDKSEDDLDAVTVKDFNVGPSSNDLDIGSAKDLIVNEVEESFLNVTTVEPLNERIATDFGKKPVSTASLTSRDSKRSSVSSCFSRISQKSILETKKHDFVSKKVVNLREKCNSCGTVIGFMTQSLKCRLCHATVHPSCGVNLPVPCLAPVTTSSSSVRFVTIGKLCPKVRPRVPPILLYCIQELDKRKGSMYVSEPSEAESKRLCDKLLSHKKGAPDLKHLTTSQLCGVVKSFLGRLDEPLITTTLWSDFRRVASTKDKADRINSLEDTLDQLPPPNRETLAMLMKHLQHVLEKSSVGSYHIKRTFAHFVVGNSQRNLPSVEVERQREIQTKLMTCFLEEYTPSCDGGWEKVLNFESCKDALNSTCTVDSELTYDEDKVTVIEKNPRRRSSVPGGTFTSGLIAPLYQISAKSPLKPLY